MVLPLYERVHSETAETHSRAEGKQQFLSVLKNLDLASSQTPLVRIRWLFESSDACDLAEDTCWIR